jgi:hypothetical protein
LVFGFGGAALVLVWCWYSTFNGAWVTLLWCFICAFVVLSEKSAMFIILTY